MANTVEELEAQRETAQQEALEQIDEAGLEAEQEGKEKGLSEDEVIQLVQKARQEEKDKLYPKIEELSNLVKQLQQHNRDEKAQQDEKERKRQEAEERKRVAKLSEEEKQRELLERIEEKLDDERKKRETLEADIASRQREDQLRIYRENAIRAAGPRIITELVYGNSEEEIDKAVERAKARYEEIENQLKQEQGQRIKGNMSTTSPGMEALEEEELEQRLPNVDTDRYLKDENYRNEIQDTLAREYARSAGR